VTVAFSQHVLESMGLSTRRVRSKAGWISGLRWGSSPPTTSPTVPEKPGVLLAAGL
jgi:hypothetical protein